MKQDFAIFSDIHLDAWCNTTIIPSKERFNIWNPKVPDDQHMLFAGDLSSFEHQDYDWWLKDTKNITYVKGNHDYYERDFDDTFSDFKTEDVNGFKIACATLWTDLNPSEWYDFKNYMADAKYIAGINYQSYSRAHDMHKKFLFNSNADIWLVHHCVSSLSIHPRFKGNSANKFFYTELYNQICDMNNPPQLIVHGHTHHEFDYMIGEKTRVICHPLGYPRETHHSYFDYSPKIITLKK